MAAKHGIDRGELRLPFEQCHPTSLIEDAACCQAVGNGDRELGYPSSPRISRPKRASRP